MPPHREKTLLAPLAPNQVPDASHAAIEAQADRYGLVPNIRAVFARSPLALETLAGLDEAFAASCFSPAEREVIALAASVANSSAYCVAAHSAFARGAGLPEAEIAALREGRSLADRRHEALRALTHALVLRRGEGCEAELRAFLATGYRPHHFLELMIGIAAKAMTNLVSKAASTPLDPAFEADSWAPWAPAKSLETERGEYQ